MNVAKKKPASRIRSAAVASRPDITADWDVIPLLSRLHPNYLSAWNRCSTINPDHAKLRSIALERVVEGIDALLLPAGYARDGRQTLSWKKQGNPVRTPLAPLSTDVRAPTQGWRSWFGQGKQALAVKSMILSGVNDGRVELSVQKSKDHSGFFLNVHVCNAGRNDVSGSAASDGMKHFRSQHFIRDVPRNYLTDEYFYARLAEDPNYLAFLLGLVEERIFPFMEAYANTATPAGLLPLATEMNRPLRLPAKERWRMYEFKPVQKMYEDYAKKGKNFSFALRDGRAFQGQIKSISNGKMLLAWKTGAAEEWIDLTLIDHGSLSYEEPLTGHLYECDFTVQTQR